MKIKKLPLLLLLILFAGFAVRFYRFDNPIADWHSWRQADTSSVSRNFVTGGFDLLHPRFDDLSNVASGKDNPQGYRFVEFPLYNLAQAGMYSVFGLLTLEEWGRLISIFSSVLAGLFLYLLVSKYSDKRTGLFAAFFYLFIPYDIYYGRTILPDTSMAMAILGGTFFFDLAIEKKLKIKNEKSKTQIKSKKFLYYLLSLIFTSSAFLLKPYALFFTLPMIVLAYKKWGFGMLKKWELWIFAIISVLPLVLWRYWMMQYPEGIPANAWLLNGNGIRFRPAFFRWMLYERLTRLISGYFGMVFFLSGIASVFRMKEKYFFLSFLLSSLLYLLVFATGNVQHDYYQILIMPSVAIFFALGASFLIGWKVKNIPLGRLILVVCISGGLALGWYHVRDYFNINNRSMLKAGRAVDELTPKDAKVIANLNGDTSFLYQTKRKGWASFEKGLPEMRQMGAGYLVLLDPTKVDLELGNTYKIISQSREYVIFDLNKAP